MNGVAAVSQPPLVEFFAAEFNASFENVRGTLIKVEQCLGESPLSAARSRDLIMVLGEVLNNIVEHAELASTSSKICLGIEQCGSSMMVSSRDNGRPLPLDVLEQRVPPAGDGSIESLPESGFGWFIIHSLVDNMTYEREEGENLLTFSFN